MRPSKRSRISFRYWNELFLVGVGTLFGYFLSARLLFSFFEPSTLLYGGIHLVLDIYLIKKKKWWVLLGAFLGTGLSFLLLIQGGQEGYLSCSGVVIEAKKNYFIFLSGGNRYYVYEKDTEHYFGDIIKLSGNASLFEETTYEGRFSFREYLGKKGVHYQINADSISSIFQFYPLRKVEKDFLRNFTSDTASLLDATLFSYRDSSDPIFSTSMSLGVYSLLSSGGVILSSFCNALYPLLKRFPYRAKRILSALLCLPFLLFGPTKIGLWKVFLLQISYAIHPKENLHKEHRLALVAFALLLFDGFAVLSSAFFYSFGLSIVFHHSRDMLESFQKKWQKKAAGRLLFEAFLFPTSVSSKKVALLAPFHRLLFLPFILPFIALGFLSFLSAPFTRLLEGYASFLRGYLSWAGLAEFSLPWVGYSGEGVRVLLYLALLCILYCYDVGLTHYVEKTLFIASCSLLLNMVPIGNAFSWQVSFINVGQGDAILLRDGYHTVLLDTGGATSFDMGEEVDIPYLYKNRIYHLDCIITTHDDADHAGGVPSIMAHYDVGRYVKEPSEFPLRVGSFLFENLNIYDASDENDSSLVLYLSFQGKRWLFMGDASSTIEKRIVEDHPYLPVDILKAGHHGSSTSTSKELLEATHPEVAILSYGLKNRYRHPDKEVVDRLKEYGIRIRSTAEEGTITYWGIRS